MGGTRTRRGSVARLAVLVALVATMLAWTAPPASATGPGRWEITVLKNGTPIFSTYGGDAAFPYPRQLFDFWNAQKASAGAELTTTMQPVLAQMLAADGATLRGLNVYVNNGGSLGFTGTGNGTVTADVTTPQVQAIFNTTKGSFDAEVWVWFGPARLSMNYNLFTGVADTLTLHDMPVRFDVYVSSNNWFIDLVDLLTGGLITDIAENMVRDQIESQISSSMETLAPALTGFSVQGPSLGSLIPDLTYQGIDVDQLLRDALAGGLVGPLVRVGIDYGYVTIPNAPHQGGERFHVYVGSEYELLVEHTSPDFRCLCGRK